MLARRPTITDRGKNIYRLKVVLVGDSNVGKTAIVSRFSSDTFTENHKTTVGRKYIVYKLRIEYPSP